jgi:protein MpaA
MQRRAANLPACAAVLGAVATAAPAATRPPETIGRSVQGRAIQLVRVGDPRAPRRVLVVGCIHGSETAGVAVTRALRRTTPPRAVQLLVLDELNPDGCRAGTRGNAHGVDLNRNFPWGWRPLGGVYASGPRPSSEPETRAAQRLVVRERPAVSIWFHQHLDAVIVQPGASLALERRYARVAGMRTRALAPLPGTAARWEQHRLPGSTSFVVELPAGRVSPARVRAHVQAVLAVARG